jgi:hypothetical protein
MSTPHYMDRAVVEQVGTTAPLPPQRAEQIWHEPSDPQSSKVHHREHLDWLHHHLLCKCTTLDIKVLQRVVRTAQYITGADPGPLYQVVSEECPKNCQRLQPPKTIHSATFRQTVTGHRLSDQYAARQLLPPSHK